MQNEGLRIDPGYPFSLQNGQGGDFPVLKPDGYPMPFSPGIIHSTKSTTVTNFTDTSTSVSIITSESYTEFNPTPINIYPPSFPISHPQCRPLTPTNPPYPTGSNMPNQDQRYFNLNPYGASWPVTVERGQQFTDGSAGMGGIAGYGLEGFSLSDPIHQDGSQNIPLAEGQHTNQSLWQSAFGPEEMPDIDLEGLTMSDPEWLASPSQSNTEAPLPHDINNLMNTHIHQNQKKFLSEASDGQPRAETEIRQGDRSPGRGPSPAQSLQSSSGFDPEDNRFFNETFGDDDYYLPAIRTPERSVSPRVISSPFYPSQGTTEDDLVDISLASPALNGPPVETMESDPLEDSPKITGEYSSSATSTSRNDDEFDFHPGSSE